MMGSARLSKTIDSALARSPFQAAHRWRTRGDLAVLAYHSVEDGAQFARQMDLVRELRRPVSLDHIIHAIENKTPLPPRAVLVTFDDGDRSVLEVAAPILLERQIPAAAFVVAGLLDTDAPFWWDEVEDLVRRGGRADIIDPRESPFGVVRTLKRISNSKRLLAIESLRRTAREPAPRMLQLRRSELVELERSGVEVGNHTMTHPCLHECSTHTIREELATSQRELAQVLGHAPRALAYPNGDHDPRVREAAEACGFRAAFLFDHRMARSPIPDPLRISRLRIDATASLERLRVTLSGLHPAVHQALGRP
ncbi:polysaccharide deacetylase family protein [Rubricoccus marinus]|uniref:NodB homology domain-containing protein n=1 Tax=Rubricoccus marinus TaxID=716817 RepID=A0A259U076_9BACT|nr:hypothetical protein BSZ36_10800 [Rubricoccus marinus]